MRIGICTTDFTARPAEELFRGIAQMGYKSVQFSFASITESGFAAGPALEIPPEISPETLAAVARASEKHDLPLVAINGTFNMAHPDPEVRREGVRRFELLADAAAELGCPILSLCTGTRNINSLWRPHPDNGTEAAWADSLDTMRQLCAIAEARSLTIAVETEASNVVRTAALARRMLDEAGSPALKMILDPANLFLPGEARAENAAASLDEAFAQFGDDIVLAHGKDIRPGDGIDFCATGLGMVDFDRMLRLLDARGYHGDWVLHGIYDETDMPRALRWAEEALERTGV